MASIGSVVVRRHITILFAGFYHLGLCRVPIACCPLLECGRVHKLRLWQVQLIADLQQHTSQLRQSSEVVEVAVDAHILGYNLLNVVLTDKVYKQRAERAVHLVIVAPSTLGEVPSASPVL